MANMITTLHYRRQHPGGGALGRCSYGIVGCKGYIVIDMGLFAPEALDANGLPPATITLADVAMSGPTMRNVAGVTSAVVATANVQAAHLSGTAIAEPAKVAATAGKVAAKVVANAKTA